MLCLQRRFAGFIQNVIRWGDYAREIELRTRRVANSCKRTNRSQCKRSLNESAERYAAIQNPQSAIQNRRKHVLPIESQYMRVILANPRGFCAGVNMAIDCVDQVLKANGPPVYVFHEIVHNKHVVD